MVLTSMFVLDGEHHRNVSLTRVLCPPGSHCLFSTGSSVSTGSSDQCIVVKHALRKTNQENWKQGNSAIEITIEINACKTASKS